MTAPTPTTERVTSIPAIDPTDEDFRHGLDDAAGTLIE